MLRCCAMTRDVTRLPGAKNKFGASLFETKVFREQMYCMEESTCDIVETFRRPPQWFGARGIVPPFPLSLRPWLSPVVLLKTGSNPWRKISCWCLIALTSYIPAANSSQNFFSRGRCTKAVFVNRGCFESVPRWRERRQRTKAPSPSVSCKKTPFLWEGKISLCGHLSIAMLFEKFRLGSYASLVPVR